MREGIGVVADALTGGVTGDVAVLTVGAAAFALLARRLNQPTITGFLVAGLLLGPVLGLVQVGDVIGALGEFGISLLLFLVGLDLSLKEARAVGPAALGLGAAQLAFSAAAGYGLLLVLGFASGTALFLAVALAFSSTVVVVKVLVDLGDLSAPYGRLAVGLLLVQDLVVVLVLTMLPAVAGGGGDPTSLALATAGAVARTGALVAGVLLVARYALPHVFRYAAGHSGLVLLLGLSWLFAAAGASVLLGVSVEVGAFAAGLGMAGLSQASDLRRGVRPLLDLFVALFFMSLGVGLDLENGLRLLPAALAFSAFVFIGKPILVGLVLGLIGYPRETSARTGIAVAQVSEFSMVVAALGLGLGLIAPAARDFVVIVAMITIAASAAVAWRSRSIIERVAGRKWFARIPGGERAVAEAHEVPSAHVLILGWDPLGRDLARVLTRRGERVLVVDQHPDVPDDLPEGVDGIYAHPEDALELPAANLRGARLVVANVPDAHLVRAVVAETGGVPPVVGRAETAEAAEALEREGAHAVLAPSEHVAREALESLTSLDTGGAARG